MWMWYITSEVASQKILFFFSVFRTVTVVVFLSLSGGSLLCSDQKVAVFAAVLKTWAPSVSNNCYKDFQAPVSQRKHNRVRLSLKRVILLVKCHLQTKIPHSGHLMTTDQSPSQVWTLRPLLKTIRYRWKLQKLNKSILICQTHSYVRITCHSNTVNAVLQFLSLSLLVKSQLKPELKLMIAI